MALWETATSATHTDPSYIPINYSLWITIVKKHNKLFLPSFELFSYQFDPYTYTTIHVRLLINMLCSSGCFTNWTPVSPVLDISRNALKNTFVLKCLADKPTQNFRRGKTCPGTHKEKPTLSQHTQIHTLLLYNWKPITYAFSSRHVHTPGIS